MPLVAAVLGGIVALGGAAADGETVVPVELEDPGEAFGANDRLDLARIHRTFLDRKLVAHPTFAGLARRRLVWSLLRMDDTAAARAEAPKLSGDALSQLLARRAPELDAMHDPEQRALARAFLPLLTRAEAAWTAGGRQPEPILSVDR